MVSGLLRMPMSDPTLRPAEPRRGFLRSFGRLLNDPFTWTSMVYMVLKLPLGIISFTLVLVLTIVPATLISLPLIYLVNLSVISILAANGIVSSGYLIPGFLEVHSSFELIMFLRSFVGVPVGIVIWIVARFLLNGLALISGELARVLLGPSVSYSIAQPQTAREPERRFVNEQQVSL
jgi:hypothetical protein